MSLGRDSLKVFLVYVFGRCDWEGAMSSNAHASSRSTLLRIREYISWRCAKGSMAATCPAACQHRPCWVPWLQLAGLRAVRLWVQLVRRFNACLCMILLPAIMSVFGTRLNACVCMILRVCYIFVAMYLFGVGFRCLHTRGVLGRFVSLSSKARWCRKVSGCRTVGVRQAMTRPYSTHAARLAGPSQAVVSDLNF